MAAKAITAAPSTATSAVKDYPDLRGIGYIPVVLTEAGSKAGSHEYLAAFFSEKDPKDQAKEFNHVTARYRLASDPEDYMQEQIAKSGQPISLGQTSVQPLTSGTPQELRSGTVFWRFSSLGAAQTR